MIRCENKLILMPKGKAWWSYLVAWGSARNKDIAMSGSHHPSIKAVISAYWVGKAILINFFLTVSWKFQGNAFSWAPLPRPWFYFSPCHYLFTFVSQSATAWRLLYHNDVLIASWRDSFWQTSARYLKLAECQIRASFIRGPFVCCRCTYKNR